MREEELRWWCGRTASLLLLGLLRLLVGEDEDLGSRWCLPLSPVLACRRSCSRYGLEEDPPLTRPLDMERAFLRSARVVPPEEDWVLPSVGEGRALLAASCWPPLPPGGALMVTETWMLILSLEEEEVAETSGEEELEGVGEEVPGVFRRGRKKKAGREC